MEELEMKQPPWASVGFTILFAISGFMIIGPLIGFMLALPFADGNLLEFVEKLAMPTGHPEIKMPYYIIQGAATLIGLAVIPALYARFIEGINLSNYFRKHVALIIFPVTLFIVIFFMGFNSVFIEWNANLHLPESMKGFEEWAREKENLATEMTKMLTQFDTPFQFIVGLLVIAVFAGIGEEFVFRGLLQPALYRATKNIHVAIWVSAILFSALHMQFFGFLPRVLLGALFGYLFYWSGNLVVPMFAHFVNNAFSVVAMYAVQNKLTDMDVESTEAASWPVVLIFTVLVAALLYYFKKQFDTQNISAA